MIFTVFLSMASLLGYVNQSNIGLWSNKTNQYVGDKLGNVLYYEGTMADINGNSSGSASITFKLNGSTNYQYTVYAYQTYTDNIHFCYSYNNNDRTDNVNLKLSVSVTIGYSVTTYYNFNRYYDYVNQIYTNESIDNNLTWVQSIWPSPDFVQADQLWFKIAFALTPITDSEMDDYTTGYEDGYSTGYTDGSNASSYSFMNLFSAIADTPIFFLRSLFNFDLFGISMISVVLTLVTGLLILGIVKHFWK